MRRIFLIAAAMVLSGLIASPPQAQMQVGPSPGGGSAALVGTSPGAGEAYDPSKINFPELGGHGPNSLLPQFFVDSPQFRDPVWTRIQVSPIFTAKPKVSPFHQAQPTASQIYQADATKDSEFYTSDVAGSSDRTDPPSGPVENGAPPAVTSEGQRSEVEGPVANRNATPSPRSGADAATTPNPPPPSVSALPEAVSAALERAELARLDDIARGFAANVAWRSHQASVYAWQLLASYVTLGIVVVVTLGGLGLAVFEILGAVRMAEAAAARGAAADRAQSSLTLSPNQMQITSAVTGVVVLALSLGFLFLFLDRVYPIQPSG